MTREEIIQLAEKVSSGLASDEEIALYNSAFNSFQPQPLSDDWDEALLGNKEEVIEEIHEGIVAKTRVAPVRRINYKKWMIAAAVTVLLMAGAAYLWFNNSRQQQTAVIITANKDIPAPDANRAVLTLANGQQIYLDSINNGTLAKQGAVTVSGKSDGEILYSGIDKQVSINSIAVPRGSKPIALSLADGTKVWIDAGSVLRFPTAFPGNTREVDVTGQAYFEVAQDKTKPFYVNNTIDGAKVEVLGTSFNVKAFSLLDGSVTTLLNGAVNLRTQKEIKSLLPLQQAVVKSGNVVVRSNVDADEVLQWKTGQFIFDGVSIHSIMQELERYYNVEVKYENEVDEKFVIRISRQVPLSEVLKALAMTQLVHFKIDGNSITVFK